MTLKSETETPEMQERIAAAFRAAFPARKRYAVDFEHGQWWVTDLTSGRAWSVVDAVPGVDGFDFEEIAAGDEES